MSQRVDLFSETTELQSEVDRRLRILRDQPDELLNHFDRNGDGVLDVSEWSAVRRVLTERVLAEQKDAAAPALERETIESRYELLSELGQGAQGKTHLARDLQHDRLVAIKLLNVAGVTEWKHFELLQREAEVLGELQHKRIPELYDSFETDIDGRPAIAVVQEYIGGDNLEFRLAAGELFDETKLMRIAEDVLVILSYLHRLNPPIIHRDVKPANIIVNENREVALVDFGAVQIEGTAQDTVIGTSGYMPPEQLMSRPTRSSDIYSLGATLIHLATRTHPGDLESKRMKLQWHRQANVSAGFRDFVDRMIEPALEDRFDSTVEALHALESVRMSGQMRSAPVTARTSMVRAETTTPVRRGEFVYEGRYMEIHETEDMMTVSIPRNDVRIALAIGFAPAVAALVIGSQVANGITATVLFFAFMLALPGVGFALYRKVHPRAHRRIDFVGGDQLTIREDGIIIGRSNWTTNPGVEVTKGRYAVVRLRGDYLNRPICSVNFGEEADMVGPVNRFLRAQRDRNMHFEDSPLAREQKEHAARTDSTVERRLS